ncbi:MAG: Ig-like domain-containing protein [Mycobacterium sp.]
MAEVSVPRVVVSMLPTVSGANPVAPVESPASWMVLAATRRQFGQMDAAASPAATVSTGQVVAPAVTAAAEAAVPSIGEIIQDTLFHKSATANPVQASGHSANGTVTGNLNASTTNGATLVYTLAQSPTSGSVALGEDGSYTYTPGAGLAAAGGGDTFSVAINNSNPAYRLTGIGGAIQGIFSSLAQLIGLRQPDVITVAVPVTIVGNSAPVAGTPTVGTPNASTGVVTGQINATDPEGNTLTYSAPASTAKGSVAINASTGAFTYVPALTARHAAAVAGAVASDKTDTFTVTISDGNGGTASAPVTVSIGATAPAKAGDIREQPGGTWRAMYAPNVTSIGADWIAVNPSNGGTWLYDSEVNSWLDVAPPTGTETAGSGPYSPGDIKVPPQSVAGSLAWFAVKTGPPLSNSYDWMTCNVRAACNTASGTDVIAGTPVGQWVDLKL